MTGVVSSYQLPTLGFLPPQTSCLFCWKMPRREACCAVPGYMYTFMYACMYVYIYIYTYIYIHAYIHSTVRSSYFAGKCRGGQLIVQNLYTCTHSCMYLCRFETDTNHTYMHFIHIIHTWTNKACTWPNLKICVSYLHDYVMKLERMCTNILVCMYVSKCIYIYIYIYTYDYVMKLERMCTNIFVCMCVSKCVCVYIYIYIYIYIHMITWWS